MKQLTTLLIAFSLTVLVISCNSENTNLPEAKPTTFQQHIIGNWEVVTPTKANYIGVQNSSPAVVATAIPGTQADSATADTISVTQTDPYYLTVYQSSVQSTVAVISFVDSSRNVFDMRNKTGIIGFNFENHPHYFVKSGSHTASDPQHTRIETGMYTECKYLDFSKPFGTLYIRVPYQDNPVVYKIDVEGISEVIHQIMCPAQ